MAGLKTRARTLVELAEMAVFYVAGRPIPLQPKAAAQLDEQARALMGEARDELARLESWDEGALEQACRAIAERKGIGFGKVAQPLRAALTGATVSPGLFEVMRVLGRDETLARLEDAASEERRRKTTPAN
jgi:glutamyl-tRNA synthetase